MNKNLKESIAITKEILNESEKILNQVSIQTRDYREKRMSIFAIAKILTSVYVKGDVE